MNKTLLRSYARLIAEVGGNVQKGQEVFITAQLDQPEFVKMLVEECYKCGAGRVVVEWNYQPLLKVDYRYRTTADLSAVRDYEEARWKHCAQVLPCRIGLISEDPSGLNGIDAGKYSTSQQAVWPIYKPLTGMRWSTSASGALPVCRVRRGLRGCFRSCGSVGQWRDCEN